VATATIFALSVAASPAAACLVLDPSSTLRRSIDMTTMQALLQDEEEQREDDPSNNESDSATSKPTAKRKREARHPVHQLFDFHTSSNESWCKVDTNPCAAAKVPVSRCLCIVFVHISLLFCVGWCSFALYMVYDASIQNIFRQGSGN